MTLVSFANEPSDPKPCLDVPSLSSRSSGESRRFTLRKRSHEEDKVNLSSYNSAFFSGLFADVSMVAQGHDDAEASPAADLFSPVSEDEDSRLDLTMPVKRSRVSLTKSVSRCARSYKNLTEVSSPVGVDTFFDSCTKKTSSFEPSCSASMARMNSLHFQLNCVDPTASPKSVKDVVDIIDMAFPHLPATVSDSSCNKQQQQDLTQNTSDQAVSDSETSSSAADVVINSKESYGWFVELDDGEDDSHTEIATSTDPYAKTQDLAFTAPTAPKRVSNYEAEVEWAQAADTIDDVLGDFF